MKPKTEWTLEDYQLAIADCRGRAAKARQSAAGWDAQAEQLRKEAAQFSTEKLPLFNEGMGGKTPETTDPRVSFTEDGTARID